MTPLMMNSEGAMKLNHLLQPQHQDFSLKLLQPLLFLVVVVCNCGKHLTTSFDVMGLLE